MKVDCSFDGRALTFVTTFRDDESRSHNHYGFGFLGKGVGVRKPPPLLFRVLLVHRRGGPSIQRQSHNLSSDSHAAFHSFKFQVVGG
jgi:hypothetical protein